MKNKRGLSGIVTTLIIILLALISVGIVWVVVKGVIDTGGSQIESKTNCIGVDVEIKSVSACNSGSTSCNVTVERNTGGGDIKGIRLVITDGFTSLTGNGAVLDVLGTITITATGSALANDATTAKVSAFVDDGSGGDVICDIVNEHSY